MVKRRRLDRLVLAWCLAVCGAILLMISTILGRESAVPQLVAGVVLLALAAVLYGVDRLRA